METVLQNPDWSILKKQKKEYGGLNEIPDEVLILILSRMPMKAAARTSVLSRRWEKLWTFHPCLIFDGSNKLLNFQHQTKGLRCPDRRTRIEGLLHFERVKYVNEVNHILKSHHASTIDEFKIRFDFYDRYQSDIDEWVKFAFGKEVRRFELDLSSFQGLTQNIDFCYKFCTRKLGLQSPTFLTSLVLKQVNVSGEVVENLVSNNPFLQCLCVGGSESLVRLRLAAPSLCLTYLEIITCAAMESLHLNAPNLLSLKYTGPRIYISFTEVPKLVELCMAGMYVENAIRFPRLPLVSTFASQLQKLSLTMTADEKWIKWLKYPELSQLKQLELWVVVRDNESLLSFSSLINAAPSLNRFALEFDCILKSRMERKKTKVIISHHYNLKVVEITGFVGGRVDTEICRYLIKSALKLEKMSIDPITSLVRGTAYVDLCNPESLRAGREQAERLRSKYGLEDKLVVL